MVVLSAADDLLYVEDFATVRQDVTAASVPFDDEAEADLFDGQVDAGPADLCYGDGWLGELEDMDLAERRAIAAELGVDLGSLEDEDVACGY